eukprot:SAG31_NODE_4210_length_3469_cov_11.547774_3_plen_108_part_00
MLSVLCFGFDRQLSQLLLALIYSDMDVCWDQNELVIDTVTKIIKLFGEDRCFFASNYPVDFGLPDVFGSWVPEKLYPAFLKLAVLAGVSNGGIVKLFAGNARKAYRA